MNVTKKLFSTFFLNIIIFVAAFSVSIIVSRVFGPENYGVYRYVLLIASTITLFANFGLPEMLQLKLAQKVIRLKDYLLSALCATTPIHLLIVFILFYLLYHGIYSFEDVPSFSNPLLLSALSFCLFYQLNSIFHNAIYALDKIVKFQLFDILKHSSFLLLIVPFYFAGSFTLNNIFWLLSIANLFSIVYVLYLNYKERLMDKPKFVYSKELLQNSLRTYINNILTFMTFRLSIIMIKWFYGFYEIGIYSISITLVEKLWLFPDSIKSVLYLELSNERKGDDFVAKLLRLMTLIIIFSGSIIFLFASKVIPFVFSDKYNDSVNPFLILLPGVMFFCYSKLLAAYFIVKNMIKINTISSIIIASTNLTLNLLLIPKHGLYGAAIASTVAYIIGSLYHLQKFNRVSHTKYADLFILRKSDFALITFFK